MDRLALVIDYNYVFHSTLGVCNMIKSKTFIPDFLAFFADKLFVDTKSIIKKYKYEQIFICRDSKSFRKKMYSEYKINRPQTDLTDYIKVVDWVLTQLNCEYTNIQLDGLEGDDLCFLSADLLAMNGYKVLIHSGDRDLKMVVKENISYFYAPKKIIYADIRNFYLFDKVTKDYNTVNAIYEGLIKIVFGDTSDDIPSALNKKSAKVVDEFLFELANNYTCLLDLSKDIDNIYNFLETKFPKMMLINALEIMKMNAKLVLLIEENLPENLLYNYKNLTLLKPKT